MKQYHNLWLTLAQMLRYAAPQLQASFLLRLLRVACSLGIEHDERHTAHSALALLISMWIFRKTDFECNASIPEGSLQPLPRQGILNSVRLACQGALAQERELCQAFEQHIELTAQATPVLQVYSAAIDRWIKAPGQEVQLGV